MAERIGMVIETCVGVAFLVCVSVWIIYFILLTELVVAND